MKTGGFKLKNIELAFVEDKEERIRMEHEKRITERRWFRRNIREPQSGSMWITPYKRSAIGRIKLELKSKLKSFLRIKRNPNPQNIKSA